MNTKVFAIFLDPPTYKGEGGMDAIPVIRFSQNFEKTIYS